MAFKYNPITDKLDKVNSRTEINTLVDEDYVNVTGDTMTGLLNIALPSPSTDEPALQANKDIILKAGRKLIFDGDL